jgi:hypothetical protein
MADKGAGRIFSVNYSPEMLLKYGVITGMAKYLYEDKFGLKLVSCMAVDTKGEIFWGTKSDSPTIYRASVDRPKQSSVKLEVSNPDKITAMHLIKNWLLFSTEDGEVWAKSTAKKDSKPA